MWRILDSDGPKGTTAVTRCPLTHPCFLFSSFMSGRRAQQLSTLRHLWIFAPVAHDHLEGAKAAVSESQDPERDAKAPIYFSASLASLHEKRESCCQSTCVALPGALFPVIHPHMVRQLLAPCSGIDLLTPSPASGSAEWLATPSWLCRSSTSSPAGL